MRTTKLTHQKGKWQNIWKRHGWLTAIVNVGRAAYNWFFRRYLRKFISKDTRLLEVGCGTATLTISLAKEMKELIGVDISEAAIAIADRNARNQKIINAEFELGDCLNLSYQDEFNVVWSQGLMEHFEDRRKVALEHYKATKPGGVALISIPYKYSYHKLWYVLTRPKFLRFLWPWTDQVFLDKKELLSIGRSITPKARTHFLEPFPLGLIILELPK